MKEIIVAEDDLRHLEKRFGPSVRLMGSWNSDGTFSYTSVPLSSVRSAANRLRNPDVTPAVSRLEQVPEHTAAFVDLLDTFGPALIAEIVAAYKECSAERMTNYLTASKSANSTEPRPLARAAAA